MHVYLGIYGLMVLLGMVVRDRDARPFYFVLGLFLLWFMGTRNRVGCDFFGYLSRFNTISYWDDSGGAIPTEEIGFEILINSVSSAGLEYMWLNVFASAVIIFCFLIFAANHRYSLLVLALQFPIMIIQLGMSGLRQAIAAGFVMLATVQFSKGSRLWTGIHILLAAQFHMSAIIFLPIALMAGRKVSTVRLTAALVIGVPMVGFILADRLATYTDRYVDQIYGETSAGGALIRYVLIFIPSLLFFLYHRKMKLAYPRDYELFKLFALIGITMGTLIFFSSVALHRIIFYVLPVSTVMLIYLSTVIFPKSQLTLAKFAPALLFGAYSTSWFLMSYHADVCYIPYQSYTFTGP